MGYKEIMQDDDEEMIPQQQPAAVVPVEVVPPQFAGDFQPPPVVQQDTAQWEARYRTLDGKYVAETRELREEVRRLQEALADKQQQAIDPKTGYQDWFAQVVEGDGENSYDTFSPVIEAMVARQVKQQVEPYQNLAAQTARETFEHALTSRISNWREIDNSPAFAQFLDNVEPLSGQTYRQLGQAAFSGLDVGRSALIYEKFLQDTKRPGIPAQLLSPGRTSAPMSVSAQGGPITLARLNEAEALFRKGQMSEEKYDALLDAYTKQRIAAA